MTEFGDPGLLRLPTPFHARSSRASRTNDWVDWNGYTVPGSYESVASELWSLLCAAGMTDQTPFCKYRIKGPQADDYMARLLSRDMGGLAPATAAVNAMCDGSGRLIELVGVFRYGRGDYALTCATPVLSWLLDAALGLEVTINEVSRQFAIMTFTGPRAAEALAAAGVTEAPELARGAMAVQERKGISYYITRIGLTANCYEMAVVVRDAELFWDRVTRSRPPDLAHVGWRAREAFRVLKGIPRAGVEFVSALYADHGEALTPFELGLGRFVDLERAAFNGQRALRHLAGKTGGRRLVRLESVGPAPAAGSFVLSGRREVGVVTSSAVAPQSGRSMALALVSGEAAAQARDLRVIGRGPSRTAAVRARLLG